MKTLKEFWNDASGIYNFLNKKGEHIDDMEYPLETEILDERLIKEDTWDIMLNVD